MKNLTFLFTVFILLGRIGLLVNVVVMNPVTAPAGVGGLIESFLFMLIFALWYWIALYAAWIIANLLLAFFFRHSIVKSIIAGASLPIAYMFFGTTWFLTTLHLIMGAAFGFFFQKFVCIDQHADISGMSPGQLGKDLRNHQSSSGNVDTDGGTAPTSKGPCN